MSPSNYSYDGHLSVSAVSSLADEPEGSQEIELPNIGRDRPLASGASEPYQRASTDSERTACPEPGSYLRLLGHENAIERHSADEIENLANTLGSSGSLVEENEATRPGSGLWKRQMLVDRSLRGMAGLTMAYAVTMIVCCISLLPTFIRNMRFNPRSSSVIIHEGQCSTMAHNSEILKIFINIAATTVLGMSNTYQQLITAPNIDELPHVLSKYGDAKIGTNSPLAINRKRSGWLCSWLYWLLLISTSLPVHFLANSLTVFSANRPILKIEKESIPHSGMVPLDLPLLTCFIGLNFTEASYDVDSLHAPDNSSTYYQLVDKSKTAATMRIYYDPQYCMPGHTLQTNFPTFLRTNTSNAREKAWEKCRNHISCTITQWEDTCHLVFRMQAGLILAVCLMVKAVYMVFMSITSRHDKKRQCLTPGDAIIAARLCSLQLSTECMLDAGESHRRRTTHECHRHCRNPETSSTGQENKHCRKCRKFNNSSELERFSTPTRATKQKRPFLSHLGQVALIQLMVLSSCSAVALSIAATVGIKIITYGSGGLVTGHAPIPVLNLWIELLIMLATNFPQFFFSVLYLVLIYNATLINMEYEWGKMEMSGGRLRCSLVVGKQFDQSYYFNLPKKVLIPTMSFSAFVHWIVSLAFQVTEERVGYPSGTETFNMITINLAACMGCAGLLLLITILCWVAMSYRRNGFIPSMFGSIRVLSAAAGELHGIPEDGYVKWGDLGEGPLYRRAGLSGGPVGEIVPEELYAGCPSPAETDSA